jgi:hypothetical protein
VCAQSCGVQSASCNTNLPCCYGLKCTAIIQPQASTSGQTVVPLPSRCE